MGHLVKGLGVGVSLNLLSGLGFISVPWRKWWAFFLLFFWWPQQAEESQCPLLLFYHFP